MRKSNEQSLGEVIKSWMKEINIEERITEVQINAAWEKIMGKNIHLLTQKVAFRNGILVVYLKSAPLREELSMAKTKILGMINAEVGAGTVKEIIFR